MIMDGGLLQKVAECLSKDKRIIFAYLYGSQARGTMREDSDVDIAIYLENLDQDPLLEEDISLKLENILHCSVDVRVINKAPSSFVNRVLKDGLLLLSRDDRKRIEFEREKLLNILIFSPLLKNTIKEGWKDMELDKELIIKN